MKNSETLKALRAISAEYKKVHGETLSELETWSFDYSLITNNEVLSLIVNKASPEPIQVNKYIAKLLQHLVAQGFLITRMERYFLTKDGFAKGSESIFIRFFEFLNRNPGIISLGALIISICSLYISIVKP